MTWKNESRRHSMASRGISNKHNLYSNGKQNDDVNYLYCNLYESGYWENLGYEEEEGEVIYGELEPKFIKYMEEMEKEIYDKFGIRLTLYSAVMEQGMIIGVEEWTDFDAMSNYGDFGLGTTLDDEKLMAKIIKYIGKKQDEFKDVVSDYAEDYKFPLPPPRPPKPDWWTYAYKKPNFKPKYDIALLNKAIKSDFEQEQNKEDLELRGPQGWSNINDELMQDFKRKYGVFPGHVLVDYLGWGNTRRKDIERLQRAINKGRVS